MNSWLRPGFSTKLVYLVALPLIGALWFGVRSAVDNMDAVHAATSTASMADLAGRLGRLIHELQIERGLSAGYASGNDAAKGALDTRREATDERLQLVNDLTAVDESLTDELTLARRSLDGLPALRTQVDGRATAAGVSTAAYTAIIRDLLAVTMAMPPAALDVATAQALTCYNAILSAKERTGQERALLNQILTKDAATTAQLTQWNGLRASQDAYLEMALALETAALATAQRALYDGPAYAKVVSLRGRVLAVTDAGKLAGFNIAPKLWFETMTAHIDLLAGLETQAAESVAAVAAERLAKAFHALVVIVVSLAILVLFSVIAAIALARSIRRPVLALAAALDRMRTKRDLSVRVEANGHDELATMGRAFNGLMNDLQSTLAGIASATGRLRESSSALQGLGDTLVRAAGTATSESQNVGAAAEEVSVSASVVAEATTQLAAATREIAGTTTGMAQSTRAAVDAVAQSEAVMQRLEASGEAIGRVIRVISDIAGQTNLLALNAAIEASSAGQYGRGFSVVADEVKKLSLATQRATTDVETQVAEVRDALRQAVAMNRSVAGALGQASAAQVTVAAAVEEQSATTNNLSGNVVAIATGSREIAQSIINVANTARSTNEVAQRTASSAADLALVATELEGLVARLVAAV